MRHPLFVVLILTIATISFGVKLNVVREWKFVDFVWDSEDQRELAINSGNYDNISCILFDVDKAPDGRLFVTSVRGKGVPASLMTVSDKEGPGGPLLRPYPSWSFNNNGCNGIISVYRVSIKCGRLYVLDCGKIGKKQLCSPKLLIFNLYDNTLIDNIKIPDKVANNGSGFGLLVTPLVYVPDCSRIYDAIIFIADVEGYGLVTYNKQSGFRRIESYTMNPTDPYFNIAGYNFTLNDGILPLTTIHKDLYYTALGGNEMYKIGIDNLKKDLSNREFDKQTQMVATLSGQTGPMASKDCAIFYSNMPDTSILCADATKGFTSNNAVVIAKDEEKLQFPSGMKIHGKKLLALTNRYNRVATNTSDIHEINYRIVEMDIGEIQKKTNCFASCNHIDHNPEFPEPPRDIAAAKGCPCVLCC